MPKRASGRTPTRPPWTGRRTRWGPQHHPRTQPPPPHRTTRPASPPPHTTPKGTPKAGEGRKEDPRGGKGIPKGARKAPEGAKKAPEGEKSGESRHRSWVEAMAPEGESAAVMIFLTLTPCVTSRPDPFLWKGRGKTTLFEPVGHCASLAVYRPRPLPTAKEGDPRCTPYSFL